MNKPIFIISGPSGVGEDTIIDELKKKLNIDKVVTTTTRDIREGEVDGISYYFISNQEFDEKLDNNQFFEHAVQYNQKKYGVTHQEIKRVQNSQDIGIWKIEYQGVEKAKELLKDDVIAIFISAPLESLERRIRERGGMTEEQISSRMEYSKKWLDHKDLYDYEVPNLDGQLDKAVNQVLEIIKKYIS